MSEPQWMEAPKLEYPSWIQRKVKKSGYGTDLIDGYHMPKLEKYTAHVGTAVAYSFRFDETFAWAIFTINDATGEFSVQSDWGNWSYRWNLRGLGKDSMEHPSGKPLTHFLATCSGPDYVCNKLFSSQEMNKFDEQETKREMKKVIIEARREDRIDANRARSLFNELEDLDWSASIEGFVHSIQDSYDLNKFFDRSDFDLYEDFVRHKPCVEFYIMCYRLLPFFFDYLRREVITDG